MNNTGLSRDVVVLSRRRVAADTGEGVVHFKAVKAHFGPGALQSTKRELRPVMPEMLSSAFSQLHCRHLARTRW